MELEPTPTGIELFDRVIDARGVLLRADQLTASGAALTGIVLTFDVGRIQLSVDPGTPDGVAIRGLETGKEARAGGQDASEEDPWWRLLGAPLTRATRAGPRLRLQFRADADNPRTISIAALDSALHIRLENTAH